MSEQNPYLSSQRVRAALRALELRPTRGMGQNFLTDRAALQLIVDAAQISRHDTIIEVGPGLGVLTWELLQRAGTVLAVELDKRLAARLQDEFSNQTQLRILQADILNLSPAQILAAANLQDNAYKLVANLPYAITSAVLRHFLEGSPQPQLLVVLVQWEVAERIVAQPGDLSVLAHSVQIYAEAAIIGKVPAASFIPAPAVDSAVLQLRVRPHPAIDVASISINAVLRLIKAGFLQPRKKLSNALPGGMAALGHTIEKQQLLEALARAGIDPQRRAETVSLEEWVSLHRVLTG